MKRIFPFLLLFFCSQAEAKIFIKPFDSIGVSASSDIRVNCDNNAIWKFNTATGDWECGTDLTGAGANITVKENNTVISSTISTDDYGIGLDATQNPTGEINISMDLTEVTAAQGPLTVAGGGTNISSISDDAVLVGNVAASGYDQPALPSCSNATTSKLLWNNTTNNWSCGTDQDSGGTPSGWTDGGVLVRITTSTDNVLVGGANLDFSADLQVVGSSDEIQLLVRGNSTQTNKLVTFENSASADQFTVDNTGNVILSGDLTIVGDDLFMATNTDRFSLLGDGTNYNPEAIDLGTDTTGSYAAGSAEAGDALTGDSATSFFSSGTLEVGIGGTGVTTITDGGVLIGKGTAAFANTGVLADGTIIIGDGVTNPTTLTAFSSATGTLSAAQFPILVGDVTTPGASLTTTIAANSVALTTDTTGNYAAGDAEAGNALTGDTATSFFSAGTIEVARGGTALASVSDDAVLIGNSAASGYDQPALPSCSNATTSKLLWNNTTNNWSCGTDQNSGGTKPPKEYWWPASATLPLEAVSDAIPPISKIANTISFDELSVDFDSATTECRTVNFKVPQDVTSGGEVDFVVDWKMNNVNTGNVMWDFRHNSGTASGVSTDIAAVVVSAAASTADSVRGKITRANWSSDTTTLSWAASDDVMGVFCRNGGNASDTATQDAQMIGAGISMART